MEEEKPKSDDELLMGKLCEDAAFYGKQLEQARISRINSVQAILNLNGLLAKTWVQIKELERRGIKRVEVRLDEGRGKEDPKGGLPQAPISR